MSNNNKSKTATLVSVVSFKRSIDRTKNLIDSVIKNIVATEAFIEHMTKVNRNLLDHPISKSLKVEQDDRDYIYELGFIALFANFEAFTYQIVKDLIHRFPKCLKESDKTIKVGSIFSMRSGKRIKEHIIDEIAIENSGQTEVWSKYLESRFNIKTMPDDKFRNKLYVLNELRNLFVHSGGNTTTLFIERTKKYFGNDIPLNQKMDIPKDKFFQILYEILNKLYLHISSQ